MFLKAEHCNPFVNNTGLVSLIDGICQRYGQRPSAVLGITNPKVAFDFDGAIAIRASAMEKEELEKSKEANKPEAKYLKEPKPIKGKELEKLKSQFNAVRNLQNTASNIKGQ